MVKARIEYGPPHRETYKTPFRPQVVWASVIVAHLFTFGLCAALGLLSGVKVSLFIFS